MANVFLIGLGREVAAEIARTAMVERHTIFERSHEIETFELSQAGIVFAGGTPQTYLALLRRTRGSFPLLPFVVVAETVALGAWLDALEAGATDYCCPPVARRLVQWFMQSLIPTRLDGLNIRVPRGREKRAGAEKRVFARWQ